MAKKSVATLQTGSKRLTKAIKMVKKEGSNSYSFVETIIDPKYVKDWIADKPIQQEVIPVKSTNPELLNSLSQAEESSTSQEKKVTEKLIDGNVDDKN
jgi:hypothetical protein|tara:strand:+ start:13090 stop:13383 length:294 start_codon:yes stop_codon:yes gene_type:complete